MRRLPVRDGFGYVMALVDACDFDRAYAHRWSLTDGYARTTVRRNVAGAIHYRTIYLHRLVTGAGPGELVDHVESADKLDCRRSNLRICTPLENSRNSLKQSTRGLTSRWKGVCRFAGRYWRATIRVEGRKRCLGYYADEMAASLAYDAAARDHFGPFARLNHPREGERSALRPAA